MSDVLACLVLDVALVHKGDLQHQSIEDLNLLWIVDVHLHGALSERF